jgi:flagellar biosynthesis protein FlhF
MRFVAIIADNPQAALTRVHEQLGPDAVIVSARKLRPEGLSWLLPGNRKIEVTACVPEKPAPVKRESVPAKTEFAASVPPRNRMAFESPAPPASDGRWRSIAWLESNGLLPAFSRQLEEKARLLYGGKALPAMQSEWTAITDLIICHWLPARQDAAGTGRPHVFIGPAGSGKTTALCKWMTSSLFFQDHRVRVWRLDGESANSAELLTLHCELTGIPMERFWNEPDESADMQFVDLPGVEMDNENAMSALRDQLSALPNPHVHLVLNAAYESSILFEQFRAFESFAPEDIIFTHLDEESRRVKLWNFVLGTKCPISFLSAGQKIPGEFSRAEPALLFPQRKAPKH